MHAMPAIERGMNWAGSASCGSPAVASPPPRKFGLRARNRMNAPTANWIAAIAMNAVRIVSIDGDGCTPGAILRARNAYSTGATVSPNVTMNQLFRYWVVFGTFMRPPRGDAEPRTAAATFQAARPPVVLARLF